MKEHSMFSIFSNFRRSKRAKNANVAKISPRRLSLECLEDRAVPAVFWVSNTGADTNSGTQSNPFQTISHALDVTGLDTVKDTINILPGTYTESMTGPANPNVAGAPTYTYALYIAPTNPVALQGVDASGAAITTPAGVLALISASQTVGGLDSNDYNVTNFAVFAANTDLLGLRFENSVASGSTASATDLITIYANNVSVKNSALRSGVTDPSIEPQPIGTNGSSLSIVDPTFTSTTTLSSITSYTIDNNIIEGGLLISHGTGIGAAQANLKVTRNAISDGYFGNIAIYGNLNAADNTFFIYDAALPTIGGVGLANNLISTASNSAWRQLVYFYQDSSLAMTKLQLDAIFAGNTIQDYAYATNSSGVPRATGKSATGGNPGDNSFFGFSLYNNVTQLSEVITDNPLNSSSNWSVSAGNLVKYSVNTSGAGLVNLSDLFLTPQGGTPSNYKVVLGTTPNGQGGSLDVLNVTLQGALSTNIDGNNSNNTITGNSGSNAILGFAGTDNLNGGGGDDTLTGGAGNDVLNGGAGIDTAVFTANFNNYGITYNSTTKIYTLIDKRSGSPDGTDTVTSVEKLQFADATITVSGVGTNYATVALGLANTPLGGVLFIGSGNYSETVAINQNVALVGFGSVIINAVTINGNARLGSTTVNVQASMVNMNQNGGTQSRPTDAVLISLNALTYLVASTINFSGNSVGSTPASRAGVYSTALDLYRRVKLVGTQDTNVKTNMTAQVTRYSSLISSATAPVKINFSGGSTTSSNAPPAPVTPSTGVYQLPTY